MEFRILGPFEVRADGHPVALPGAKPRALLAALVVHANESVSVDQLALAVWGEDAPATGSKTVQVYVSRLRKALRDAGRLETTPGGYRLRVPAHGVDAHRFEAQVATARAALAAGRADRAAKLLRDALALWRGQPLANVAWAPFAAAEIARLEELRWAAVEMRVEADLAGGRDAELVGELQQLTRAHPWRERLHAQLMLALYRSGRQADALAAYRHARAVLVGQLGIEPGPELHELHQALLVHDPLLAAPPASVAADPDRRGAVPAPPNRTIGRRTAVAAIAERLRTRSVHLLTLTGPGGVGKTRLAMEAARTVETAFGDGARFVSLAAVSRASDVPAAMVTTLGIIQLAGESAEQAIARALGEKALLLVLDNCEHVSAAARFIGGLPAARPGVTVLATSRAPLRAQAEQCHPVAPLALPGRSPPGCDALIAVAAVELFCERARARDPGFHLTDGNAVHVAEICRRVDGLPLAIELAAARCGLLTPAEIAEHLDGALRSPGAGARDAPPRQQTLWATIDWSHDLLAGEEKTCFARFAVFAGGATIEAAETVTGAGLDVLDGLVAKCLLVRRSRTERPTRLDMLQTVRSYAAERFAGTADAESIRERHHRYCLALVQRHASQGALWGASRLEHLAWLDPDIDNVLAALEWAESRDAAGPLLELCAAVGEHWLMRNRFTAVVEWAERALRKPGATNHPALRVHILRNLSWALWPLGRVAEQRAVMAQARAIAEQLGDLQLLSHVVGDRATQESFAGRFNRAAALADEALVCARATGDTQTIAMAAFARAVAEQRPADLRTRVDRAAALLAQTGNAFHTAVLYHIAGHRALSCGCDGEAVEFCRRAIPLVRELESPYEWLLLRGNFGMAALLTRDIDTARRAFREQLQLCRELAVLPAAAQGLRGLAAVAAARDELDRAARLVGASAAHRHGQRRHAADARLDRTFLVPARARLGAMTWDAAVRQGAALSFEAAIAIALQDEGSPRPAAASVR